MKLLIISSAHYFKGEAALVNQLFEAGMPVFHLRKEGPGRDEYACLIAGINERYHDRIALHQFHELIQDFPAIKRLHYPERLRKERNGGPLFKSENQVLSTSVHNLDDLKELEGFDYAFYGPVFDSFSKPGYKAVTTAGFQLPRKTAGPDVIALGGIDAGKIDELKQMGFDGAGLLGAIWNNSDHALDNFNKTSKKCSS